jgi:hypothetical protein
VIVTVPPLGITGLVPESGCTVKLPPDPEPTSSSSPVKGLNL